MGRIITLTTDFGNRDWFAGSMKGAIKKIAPDADVIDITHELPPGDVRAGSFVLEATVPHFPRGTIHVAVIDPGVGSRRSALLACGKVARYLGPDNGVLSRVLSMDEPTQVYRLCRREWWGPIVSATFHGRDIFGPVAAHLARGVPPHRMGLPVRTWHRLDEDAPAPSRGGWRGRIVYLDRFGNAITNLVRGVHAGESAGSMRVRVGRWTVDGISTSYSEGRLHRLAAVWNSVDRLELALRGGSAADAFNLVVGQTVMVQTMKTAAGGASKSRRHGR